MNPKSCPQLKERYGRKFIAKEGEKVIASAKTSKALWNKVRTKVGNRNMVIEYIEPKGAICIYGASTIPSTMVNK